MACTLAFVGIRAIGPVLNQPGCHNNDQDPEIVLSITLLHEPLLFGWARCNTSHGGSRGNTHSGEPPFDGRSHCECLYRKYLCRKHHNQQPRNSQLTAFCRRGIDTIFDVGSSYHCQTSHQVQNCSPASRERELGLDRRETG